MPRGTLEDDEWDDEEAGKDEDSTVPCPYCKRPIPDDSPRCPYCENYISQEDQPPRRKPWLIIIGALLCLYIVYYWIFGTWGKP
jgi:predicted nucleic acid-binding Zn ribbon protein